jgi:hypothetical protein
MDHLGLLDDTIQFWQGHVPCRVTQEDARQAIENINGFFEILEQWATAAEATGGLRGGKEAA